MIDLILAIACSAMVSIVMRLSERRVSGNISMLMVNYLMCLAVAGVYMGPANWFPRTEGITFAVGLGVLNGLLYLLGFVMLQLNVKRNGVVLSATFMRLGLLVPMIVSVFVFREMPEAFQWIGFLLAVAAIILINLEKEQTAMKFKGGLFLLLLAGGSADTMSKLFEELGQSQLSEQFLFYTFLSAFLLCAGLACFRKEKPGWTEVFYGLLVGIPNYFSARFLLRALGKLPAVLVYPTYSVATIVVVTLAGVFIFRERLGRRQKLALCVILAALVLLNR